LGLGIEPPANRFVVAKSQLRFRWRSFHHKQTPFLSYAPLPIETDHRAQGFIAEPGIALGRVRWLARLTEGVAAHEIVKVQG
jgi:hypothetical protein